MAANLLQDVLTSKTSLESLKAWLNRTDTNDIFSTTYRCTRDEFLHHYQEAIRDYAVRILSSPAVCVTTKTKRVKPFEIGCHITTGVVIDYNTKIPNPFPSIVPIRNTLGQNDWHKKNASKNHTQANNTNSGVAKGYQNSGGSASLGDFLHKETKQKRGKSNHFKNSQVHPKTGITKEVVSITDGDPTAPVNPNNHRKDCQGKNSVSQENKTFSSRVHPKSAVDGGFRARNNVGSTASLGDFMQIDNQQRKGKPNRGKNNTPRRINPTRVAPIKKMPTNMSNTVQFNEDWNTELNESFSQATASCADNVAKFTQDWNSEVAPVSFGDAGSANAFATERDLMRIERLKIQQPSAMASAVSGLPAGKMSEADQWKVTGKDQLDILISLYCYILESNLALNPSSEICFITNLLVVTDFPDSESNVTDSLLDSVHNCVYFACSILDRERYLLAMFDRMSLKLLKESDRIKQFAPQLSKHLKKLLVEVKNMEEHPSRDGSRAIVNFHCETDNRDNFPSEYCFHNFKKQRDLFYESLHTWEKSHNSQNWSFAQTLGSKIKMIVCGKNEEPSNLVHFCRLFRSQLLGNCSGTLESGEDDLDEDTRYFLKSLKSQDPNKYARLKERLVRPRLANSVQRSDFPGHQEFYRDFILTANNSKLNAHMIDSFRSEIAAICSTSLVTLRTEDLNCSGQWIVDDTTSHAYAANVASLRVLAKFLGFLTFLPYRSEMSLSNNIATQHAAVRTNTNPPVDVRLTLHEAIANNQLVLAVPWVTKYISMADTVTMSLPYYVTLTNMLFHLYVTVGQNGGETCPSTVLLVRLSLGWLFETPNFPGGQFLAWYFDAERPAAWVGPPVEVEEGDGLDSLPLAGRASVLHAACPGLRKLAVMLATQGGNSSRHVTPAAVARRKPQEITQPKIEESFFKGQVPTLRRTVMFVSERVASACVTYLSGKLLPQLKATTLAEYEDELPDMSMRLQNDAAKSYATMCALRCRDELKRECTSRTACAMEALLPQDMIPEVRQVSAQIAGRIALEKAQGWLEDNMIAGSFEKDLLTELDRLHRKAVKNWRAKPCFDGTKTSHTVEPGARNVVHDDDAPSPTAVICELRDLVLAFHTGKTIRVHRLTRAITDLKDVFTRREDLIPTTEVLLHALFMDLLFTISVYEPDMLADVLPLVHVVWMLPELQPTAQDATILVSSANLLILARRDLDHDEMQAFFTLLDVVACIDNNTPKLVLAQLRAVAAEKGLHPGVIVIVNNLLHLYSGAGDMPKTSADAGKSKY